MIILIMIVIIIIIMVIIIIIIIINNVKKCRFVKNSCLLLLYQQLHYLLTTSGTDISKLIILLHFKIKQNNKIKPNYLLLKPSHTDATILLFYFYSYPYILKSANLCCTGDNVLSNTVHVFHNVF